jgi:hypothetical protein
MVLVHPSRDVISDRFPVASFVVKAPPERVFEVACATDPALFSPQHRAHRTPANFYSSRAEGLMRAPGGQATWLVPSDQLRRFAGASRVYYAVAHYGNARGEDPRLSVSLQDPRSAPYIRLSPDFTGRALDRARFGGAAAVAEGRYGKGRAADLVWGGDLVGAPTRYGEGEPGYDDGFDPALWNRPAPRVNTGAVPPVGSAAVAEPPGFEDAVAYAAANPLPNPAQPLPGGAQPAVPLAPQPAPLGGYGNRDGGSLVYGGAEPSGLEHPPRRIGSAAARSPVAARPAANPFLDAPHGHRLGGDGEAAPAAMAPAPGVPLTIQEKLRIVQIVARGISGPDRYAFVDTSDGLAWGLLGFRQATGGLGAALTECRRRDDAAFARVFGADADEILRVTTAPDASARLAPVGGALLTDAAWITRFRDAGGVEAFKFAQNQAAVEGLLDPLLHAAFDAGVGTDRGLAALLDSAVQLGVDGARQALAAAGAGAPDIVLDRLVTLAEGTPTAVRLQALRRSRDLNDTVFGRA